MCIPKNSPTQIAHKDNQRSSRELIQAHQLKPIEKTPNFRPQNQTKPTDFSAQTEVKLNLLRITKPRHETRVSDEVQKEKDRVDSRF